MISQDMFLNALRSGEYKQTKYCLKDDEGFCGLGVLTDLYIKQNDLTWDLEPINQKKFSFQGMSHIAHKDVNEACEIDNTILGMIPYMNDSGKSFEEIADYLEETISLFSNESMLELV